MLKRTPLYDEHLKLGAKIVPFAGWEMPVSYKGIIAEHESVRQDCGVFDVSHMGIIDIESRTDIRYSKEFILRAATNNAGLLSENEGQYSVLCNDSGGTIDDIFVFRLKDCYRLVVNASNTDKNLEWLKVLSKNFKNISIVHRADLGILSLQGPKAKEKIGLPSPSKRNHCSSWGDLLYSRTGYTGEDGFEFFVPNDSLENLWESFMKLKISPCGLGARDTLRLEAGLPLYGHEYDEKTSPLEVGYAWAVKFDHDFIGKASLLAQKEKGVSKKLVGLKFSGRAIPRQGAEVFSEGEKIGVVTSGSFSPTLKIPVALAFVAPNFSSAKADILIRGKLYPAVVSNKKMV